MTGCRFFYILGILSLYTDDPTFLIIGNGPALLKASFLAGQSELIFEPSTVKIAKSGLRFFLFPFSFLFSFF